ncbi:hypothetical protein cce_2114 [Crocosphaera subtropica ATCC 51142]|uniref:DUF1622 domain-containing protein n=1 Tax=Crocosphaera subtropica (strain ATCC 51142 / BH68) TaxID=43989 RepID=B1WNN5_CROS5|nr:DUF1622 domain-containing protein [Crocosphaera subtropica]ACB51464.1 hypothetical protein cce_2114 [Crocosphaera subtropica ATCC 51142]
MELFEHIEGALQHWVTLFRLILESVSVLCVVLGLLSGIRCVIMNFRFRSFPFLEVRLRFGSWLALALEFQLGSDVLSTTIAPSFQALGKLGAIAVIRTFLNYFLTQELEAEQRLKERKRSSNV